MKKLVFGLFALFPTVIGTPGCKKGHQFMSQGMIVGWNYGSCAICGGFYLNMSDDTVKDSSTYYVINWADGLDSVINQYAVQYNRNHSPIYVSFDWQRANLGNLYTQANWIRVTAIQSR